MTVSDVLGTDTLVDAVGLVLAVLAIDVDEYRRQIRRAYRSTLGSPSGEKWCAEAPYVFSHPSSSLLTCLLNDTRFRSMPDTEERQYPPSVARFDWRAELRSQERNAMWLSRRSGIGYRTVYRIINGEQDASPAQIVAFARALGVSGPDGADL